MADFIPFPLPQLKGSIFKWLPVDQPIEPPTNPLEPLRERRLLLIGENAENQIIGYDGFGRELETFILSYVDSSDIHIEGGLYTRASPITLRILNNIPLEVGRRYLDLIEDIPIPSSHKTEIVPRVYDEQGTRVLRDADPAHMYYIVRKPGFPDILNGLELYNYSL